MFYINDAMTPQLDPIWWRKRLNSSILRKARKGKQKHTHVSKEKQIDLLKALTVLQTAMNGNDMDALKAAAQEVYELFADLVYIAIQAEDANFKTAATKCQNMARKLADHAESSMNQAEFVIAYSEGRAENYAADKADKAADYANI